MREPSFWWGIVLGLGIAALALLAGAAHYELVL